jgi:hypothetical protein
MEVLDGETGKTTERLIKSLKIEVDDPSKSPKATVECLDVGFDVELASKNVDFQSRLMSTFSHEERAHITGALEAAKVLVKGGDSRSAMLRIAEVCNTAKVAISKADVLDRIIAIVKTPPQQNAPEEESEDDDPVVAERIMPKEPLEQPQRKPQAPQPWTPQAPNQQVPSLRHDGDDPLRGASQPK